MFFYLGLGLLRWSDRDDEWIESPIVLKPVTLFSAHHHENPFDCWPPMTTSLSIQRS